ncbi:MAG: L-2-hydroxyglutarate oxidase [Lewinellaceae bacterium]|nr:L-2-hydroxyglutarate oxidase [Lewinellaceae bacterium]
MKTDSDVLIVGAGIVGLATALQLQQARPHLRITILEKEAEPAAHQSSHNSGVLHSGIYYRPGSLRAQYCRRGYEQMVAFCAAQHIPFEVCGKIIVAVNDEECSRLDNIVNNGLANGLQGIRKISAEESSTIEPSVQAKAAVWVPQAGIVDYSRVAKKYAELLQANGALLATQNQLLAIQEEPNVVRVDTSQATFRTKMLVNCGGLYADRIASMAGLDPKVQILPFRGEYYELKPASQHLVRNLVYPVPNPNFPFLGVHFTRMIQGGMEAGPNAVLAYRREGYTRHDFHWSEFWETLRYPGFVRLARKYWRDGWLEFQRSYSKKHFTAALQRLVPDITENDLQPGHSGVRAMACTPEGQLLDDFLFLEKERQVHVVNAPSPAATASLMIGETVAQKVMRHLDQ